MSKIQYDYQAWGHAHKDDAWIFDKLVVARKLGYICGPAGVPVPRPGTYIVRPCVNVNGMGYGVSYEKFYKHTENRIPPGYFWSEIFKGRHLSVDYYRGKQILCVEGIKPPKSQRWECWKKTNKIMPIPKIISELRGKYKYINIEFIGNKIIEIHLRPNPDFAHHNSPYVLPVWEGEKINPPIDHKFIKDEAEDRLGFYIKE